MKTESKTDLLLQMTEQPEQYTEEQWRDILSDDECRELYTLMALTQGAMRAAQADAALTEDEITEEWEKVKREKYRLPEPSEGKSYFSLFTLSSFTFKKTAAIFIAAVFLGGLSFAAYRVFSPPKEQQPREVTTPLPHREGQMDGASVRFSDVRLDSVLAVVSAHYEQQVQFLDEAPRELRFTITWNCEDSLATFIETLNEFDGLRLYNKQDTIFVKSI